MTTLMTGQMPGGRGLALDDDVDLERDRALVERAQSGDRSAFDDLYQRYYRRLYRFCFHRLQDTHEAEDVAQEAFARAWRALPSFAGDRRFYPWLSVIAAHLCTDIARRRTRSTPVADFHQSNMASIEDSGEDRVLAAVDSDLVAQAFQRLSDRHQRILEMREGSGWSYQRIADHEGVGITAIETLLWRARQALKREFTALAGNDGRTAGVLGGAMALAALRRLLRSAAAGGRRLAHSGVWTTAAAIGTAAAVSAAVVASTAAGPTTVMPVARTGDVLRAAPAPAPFTTRPVTPAFHGTSPAGSHARTTTAHPASTGSSSLGGSSSAPAGVGLPGPAAGVLGGAGSAIGATVQGLSSTIGVLGVTVGSLAQGTSGLGATVQQFGSTIGTALGGVTGTVGNAVQSVGSSLPGALSAVSPLTTTIGTAVGTLPSTVTSGVTNLHAPAGTALQGTSSSGSSGAGTTGSGGTGSGSVTSSGSSTVPGSSTLSGTSCTVVGTVDTAGSTVSGLLGGSTTLGSSSGCPS
ncbi:MAG: sigma-70 family RNA polymerase sigma factor [Actinomycetota bacterium]|nr:sigma-70 family RNA polymerase sigma factor [Actinomycetota bacterium]